MPIDTVQARATLLALREELRQLSAMTAGARETVMLDQNTVGRLSRMDSIQQRAMAQATERQRASELAKIDAALKRLEEGEYGYCVVCGEEIGDKRLRIDPAASHCINCAAGTR